MGRLLRAPLADFNAGDWQFGSVSPGDEEDGDAKIRAVAIPFSRSLAWSFLGRGDTLLVIQSRQLFTFERAEALRAIVARLEQLDTVASVGWMDNAPPLNIFGLPGPWCRGARPPSSGSPSLGRRR